MIRRQPRNLAASVRDRLFNLARERREDFQAILTRYAVERLLYRLSISKYRDQFLLKGAMLFFVWSGQLYRPTETWTCSEPGKTRSPVLGDYEAADNLMHYIGLESAVLGKDWERARDRFISGWGGVELVGTPEQIIERLSLIAETGYDGTLLMFPIWEAGLAQFRDKVMPLLEQAGLRKPYVPPAATRS